MQVLWDSSWAWRLWCAFESAAFLHSRPPVEKTNIRIRPTILGVTLCATWFACFVGGFAFEAVFYTIPFNSSRFYLLLSISLASCGVVFWYTAHLAREYCRDIITMCQQIRHFRITMAQC